MLNSYFLCLLYIFETRVHAHTQSGGDKLIGSDSLIGSSALLSDSASSDSKKLNNFGISSSPLASSKLKEAALGQGGDGPVGRPSSSGESKKYVAPHISGVAPMPAAAAGGGGGGGGGGSKQRDLWTRDEDKNSNWKEKDRSGKREEDEDSSDKWKVYDWRPIDIRLVETGKN